MKAILTIPVLFFCYMISTAQIGINNTSPKATLDITATNQAVPSYTDGILIPRIDAFPIPHPLAAQHGMLVYLTTASGSHLPGFYYWDNNSTSWIPISDTRNTLDQAYDEGGAGVGRIITADNGAVEINGDDGFQVTGALYLGDAVNLSGVGTRMFFNPRKAAFRAGNIQGNFGDFHNDVWDDVNIGRYSFATGRNTLASGESSTAFGVLTEASGKSATAMGNTTVASGNFSTAIGDNTLASGLYATSIGRYTTASGNISTVMGFYTTAPSFAETVIGMYNSNYSPNTAISWNPSDRLFVVGNGTSTYLRGNALTIYKNGLMNINDEYNMPLTDGTANQVMATDGAGNVSFVDPSTIIAKNTLDQAYDEGGAGAGRIITADNGAVEINGGDGFHVTGTFGHGSGFLPAGFKAKMFFNPKKAAFRAGNIVYENNQFDGFIWSDAYVGDYSFATGQNTLAKGRGAFAAGLSSKSYTDFAISMGDHSEALGFASVAIGINNTASGAVAVAMGQSTAASGNNSIAMGYNTTAYSYGETVVGMFNSNYSPNTAISWNPSDRLFVVGNGTSTFLKGNALTIYKSGLMNINDEYNMPLTDGTANQVMATDGAGNVSFVDPNNIINDSDNQDLSLSGNTLSLTNDATPVDLSGYLDNTDNQDLSLSGNTLSLTNDTTPVDLSGYLDNTDDQTIDQFNLTGTTLNLSLENDGMVPQTVDLSLLQDADWYEAGGTPPNNINDDIYTYGNVSIGSNNFSTRLFVEDDNTNGYVAEFYNTLASSTAKGVKIRLAPTTTTNNNYFIGFVQGFGTGGGTNSGKIVGNGTGVLYQTTSDRRLKTHIVSIDDALHIINEIKPRQYEYKALPGKKEYGFIAQELQTVYPQAVSGDPNGDVHTAPMMVDYSRLTPILTAGIKELNDKVKSLEDDNKSLKNKMKTIMQENKLLKQKLEKIKTLEKRIQELEKE